MYQRGILLNPVTTVAFRAILLISLCWSIAVYGDAKSECNAVTGGKHTRIVWVDGGDALLGVSNAISGFDSKTGKITKIYSGKCVKCVLCYGGHKVLFTSGDYKVWIIDFDGTNAKQLLEAGNVSDGWRDPKTGTEWAVYRGQGRGQGGGINRINIDDPTQKIELYSGNAGHTVYPWFQMSADGTFTADFMPYGTVFVYDIVTKKKTKIKSGPCWASTASDNSYNWFHLNGGHTSLGLYNKTKGIGSLGVVPPAKKGADIYCPRFAEGTEETGLYFTLGGGYSSYSSPGIEIFLGKFGSDLRSVEKWARITNDNVANHHSSAWIGVESETGDSATGMLETSKQNLASQLSVKMAGSKTVELNFRQKEFIEIEIVNPMGLVVEKSLIAGNSKFRWSGLTAGVYLIRLTGQNNVIRKKITLW